MTDLLNAKADLSTPEARQAMLELDERLRGNQKFLQQYLAAAEALRQQGVAALDEYESAAKAYTGYIVSNMGHHAGSVDLARAAFSPADWESMAFVSEADAQREEELFQAVFAHKPDALSLEGSESL